MSGSSSSALAKPSRRARLRELLPDLWAIIAPRKWILIVGMVLIGLTRLAAMAPPVAMKYLIDEVIAKRDLGPLPLIVLAVSGAAIFQQLVGYVLIQMFSRSTTRLIGELRMKLQAHVMRLSLLYHDRSKSGSLGSRIMNDVQGLQNLVGTGFLNFIGSIMTSLIALAIMARFSLALTAIALVTLLTLAVIVARGTRRVREIAHARTKIMADVVGRLTESLGGVRVVKAYRAEEREDRVFGSGITHLVSNLLDSVNLTSRLNLSTGLLWGAVSATVLWVGAHRILDGTLTLGGFLTFNALLLFAVQPLMQIVSIGNMLMEALAGLERTREILSERREDADPKRTVAIGPLRGEVAFEGVHFAYDPDKPVLRDVSFRAEPGTVTAFVGPSGSGKSTTIGLIASFYEPSGGKVLVDGVDLTTVKVGSYRSQLGVVLQETFLFAGTILENVAFARPDATKEEILAACRTARVDEFADKLPDKYETVVGERGVMLSGGQRQRISIARALLADPRILILDEATSSLDTHSEALIQEALSHLLEGRTTFVIAHRLSTIRKADQILVVEQGQIIERGKHEELLAAKGKYADMYTTQHQIEENLFLAPGEGAAPDARNKPALPAGAGDEPVGIEMPSL
jgi:ABC-type multidrug transport system fused ATPase/permease subunit